MPSLRLLLPTLWRLGLGAVARAGVYRIACWLGYYRLVLPIRQVALASPVFSANASAEALGVTHGWEGIVAEADDALNGFLVYYSWSRQQVGSPPEWFRDPMDDTLVEHGQHWSAFDEFSRGDIKNVWEPSRFQWAVRFAQAWRLTWDRRYVDALNAWVADWVAANPVNSGPNWKCGQESSIRLLHILLTAYLVGEHREPTQSLVQIVESHCERIFATMHYALAQQNNHSTSEAAALFVAGAWLGSLGLSELARRRACSWRSTGRKRLEQQIRVLVAEDGSFSQYSTNYHRVLIDTLCQVEFWRTQLAEDWFTHGFRTRCKAAVDWLAAHLDADSGCVPNLGANDGARLFDLCGLSYEDFRPTLQLGSWLFCEGRYLGPGAWDASLQWLGQDDSGTIISHPQRSRLFAEGGYAVLRRPESWCTIRFAEFRFRPSHADCGHVDLWHSGINILRDGGTYSYNTDPRWINYFSGTASHNTVQFDDRNQMPRLGRFLFADWINMRECSQIFEQDGTVSWSGAYVDSYGAWHRRTVLGNGNYWKIIDEVDHYREKAVIRWRLAPELWYATADGCESRLAHISVRTPEAIRRMELVEGWESRHYMQKTSLTVLEIEIASGPSRVETEVRLRD